MTRVPYAQESDLDSELQYLLATPNNVQQALANSPIAFEKYEGVGRWILYDAEFEPRKRELMIIAAAYLSNAIYPFCHHINLGLSRAGLTADEINQIPKVLGGLESTLPEVEVLLVKTAAMLTRQKQISDELWNGLREYYGHKDLVEVVYIVGFYVMVCTIANGLEVDLEPRFDELRSTYWDAWRSSPELRDLH